MPWNPDLKTKARNLQTAFSEYTPEDVTKAVEAELRTRMSQFAEGVHCYRSAPRHALPSPVVTHALGTTRLLDFSVRNNDASISNTIPLLIIPSLVNRYTVLNLSNGQSFVHTLATAGFQPFIVDWDTPGPEEKSFDLSMYVTERLEPLLTTVQEQTGYANVGIMGYCMGGLLALALAVRNPTSVSTLTLLATPWDFHSGHEAKIKMLAAMIPQLDAVIGTLGELPVDILQAMFTSLNPWLALEKFRRFSRMEPTSPQARAFIDLEDWLNSGVPLAGAVAKECLHGWYVENLPMRNRWDIAGTPIAPQEVNTPTLSVIPENDHIVPSESAKALANVIPNSDIISVPMGHIGMIAGKHAARYVHEPMISWLKKNQH